MARYVTDKNGITIGSTDNFFFIEEGKSFDFPVTLWANSYRFDQINTLNVKIRTPAEQILFVERLATDDDRKISGDAYQRTVIVPSEFIADWLDRNCPGWGFPPACRRADAAFFFTKRKHALALRQFISEMLKGVRLRDRGGRA